MLETVLYAGVHNALFGTALAGAVWGITRLWRHPLAGRWLWLIVLVKFLTPPVWPLAVAVDVSTVAEGLPERAGLVDVEAGFATDLADVGLTDGARAIEAPPYSQERPYSRTMSPAEMILLAWGLSSLGWFGVAAYRVDAFDRAQRGSAVEVAELSRRVGELASRLRLRRVPAVRAVNAHIAPMLWSGWGRAVILVPSHLLAQLESRQLDTVLAHELTHFRHGDHWVRRLSLVCLSLYWWHPVAWFACRQLRENEENCCDATVLEQLRVDRQSYAETLFHTACFARGARGPAPALGFASDNPLKRRIEEILDSTFSAGLSRPMQLTIATCAAVLPLSVRLVASDEAVRDQPGAQTAVQAASDSLALKASTDASESSKLSAASPVGSIIKAVSLSSAAITESDFAEWRAKRPYGEIGFPGTQFGAHWEVVRLATHLAVIDELNADEDQRTQLKGVWNSLMGKSRWWRRGESEEPDLLRSEFEQVTTILTPEQHERVRELIVQRKGLSAFLDETLRTTMGLSGEQVDKVRRAIQDHSRRVKVRNEALDAQVKSIGADSPASDVSAERLRGARLEANQSNRQSLTEAWRQAWGVLRPEQRAVYERLAGGPSR